MKNRTPKFRLARIFLAVDRRVEQALRALRAIHQGLWLGLLDRASLNQVTAFAYLSMVSYQGPVHNLSGLFKWEEAAVEKFFGRCRTILVGGAGGGREIVALSRRNFKVDGFDSSPALVQGCLELLAQEGIRAEVTVSLPDQVPEPCGLYDGLIVGWGAYVHIQGRRARIEFLRRCRSHVRPGGPVLLSFWAHPSSERELLWAHAVARVVRRLRGHRDPVERGDAFAGYFVHYFTEQEVRAELEEAGFGMLFYSDDEYPHAVGVVGKSPGGVSSFA